MIPIHLGISNCWKVLIATEPIVEGNEKALASQYRVKIETLRGGGRSLSSDIYVQGI